MKCDDNCIILLFNNNNEYAGICITELITEELECQLMSIIARVSYLYAIWAGRVDLNLLYNLLDELVKQWLMRIFFCWTSI